MTHTSLKRITYEEAATSVPHFAQNTASGLSGDLHSRHTFCWIFNDVPQ
jgi:hypothetical protein